MFSLKEIIKEISRGSELSEDEVSKRVEEKQVELSGLVSPEGAAYIIGKELGVNLLKESAKRQLKISNVLPGMRSVDVTGKVVNISEKRDFEKNGKKGSVVNLLLGDDTGSVRLPLWNNEIDVLEKLGVKEGDVVKITGGYVKENRLGNNELGLGRTGKIEKTDVEITVKEVEEKADFKAPKRSDISDLKEGEYAEVKASLVQVFRKSPFFEVCPTCESSLEKEGDVLKCKDHGKVEPKQNLVLSGVIDDGSGNIRVVFFRDLAEKVFGRNVDDLKKTGHEEPLKVYDDLNLGEDLIIRGRVKKNQFTERLELVANEVERFDPKKESENIMKHMKSIKD